MGVDDYISITPYDIFVHMICLIKFVFFVFAFLVEIRTYLSVSLCVCLCPFFFSPSLSPALLPFHACSVSRHLHTFSKSSVRTALLLLLAQGSLSRLNRESPRVVQLCITGRSSLTNYIHTYDMYIVVWLHIKIYI